MKKLISAHIAVLLLVSMLASAQYLDSFERPHRCLRRSTTEIKKGKLPMGERSGAVALLPEYAVDRLGRDLNLH